MSQSREPLRAALRQRVLQRRRNLSAEDCDRSSRGIQQAVLESAPWRNARVVLAYRAMPDEVETRDLLENAISEGKTLLLPRCVRGEKRFEAVGVRDMTADLAPGPFRGLLEPRGNLEAAACTPDVIIVPGVAFDPQGNRLGFGAGMYDRFLAGCPGPPRIALAFECQIVDEIPAAAHDEAVDAVRTEKRWLVPVRDVERRRLVL